MRGNARGRFNTETGPGVYRFLIGDALLGCRNAISDFYAYARAVEHLLDLAWPLIDKHRKRWEDAMTRILVDPLGQPLKRHQTIAQWQRHLQIRELMWILRKEGVFAPLEKDVNDGMALFGAALEDPDVDELEEEAAA